MKEEFDDLSEGEKMMWIVKKVALYGFILIIGLNLIFGSWFTIGAGERGVLLTLGNPSDISYSSGFHFKMPIIQKVVKMNVQTLKYEGDAAAASSDLQTITAKLAINYHLEADSVPRIYRELGLDYSARIIQPLEQEVIKATTARYTAEELITKRENVREDVKVALSERLTARGIIVEDVSIVNFDFSKSFNEAIENKVTAEQNALAAKNKLAQVDFEAQQRVTQAQGEAEAIRIQAQAITAQGGKEYVQLQAISKWDGKMPLVTGGNSLPFINIGTNSTA